MRRGGLSSPAESDRESAARSASTTHAPARAATAARGPTTRQPLRHDDLFPRDPPPKPSRDAEHTRVTLVLAGNNVWF
jgi:hypothetical protein